MSYLVGGCVRDFLLEREVKDHDIATSASPDELVALFPGALTVGKKFGVLKVPVESAAGERKIVEVATFRQDLGYADHRRPSAVRFSNPREDAIRRDFTVNALFYDFKTGRVLDAVGGYADLKAKIIRAIGRPEERFREDALRLLRAARFATALDFGIEPVTEAGIRAKGGLLRKISGERIRDELTRMLLGTHPERAIELLAELRLLLHALPELADLLGADPPGASRRLPGDSIGPWKRTLRILEWLGKLYPAREAPLLWAGLLLEARRFARAADAEDPLRLLGARIKLSNGEIASIDRILEAQPRFREVYHMREATLLRFVSEPGFAEMLALQRAVAMSTDGNLANYEFCASRHEEAMSGRGADSGRLINGEDLIELGFQPGPRFAEILRAVEDLALERKLASKDEALEYVVRHFVK